MEVIKKKIEGLKLRQIEADKKKEQYEQTIKRYSEEIDKNSEMVANLQNELDGLLSKLEEIDTKYEQLQTELEELERQNIDAEMSNQRFTRASVNSNKTEIIRKRYERACTRKAEVEAKIEQATTQLEESEKQLDVAETDLSEIEQKFRNLGDEQMQAANEFQVRKNARGKVDDSTRRMQQAVTALRRQVEQLKVTNEKQEGELNNVTEELEKIESDLVDATQEHATLTESWNETLREVGAL